MWSLRFTVFVAVLPLFSRWISSWLYHVAFYHNCRHGSRRVIVYILHFNFIHTRHCVLSSWTLPCAASWSAHRCNATVARALQLQSDSTDVSCTTQLTCVSRISTTSSLLVVLLLLRAGVETNPGPSIKQGTLSTDSTCGPWSTKVHWYWTSSQLTVLTHLPCVRRGSLTTTRMSSS